MHEQLFGDKFDTGLDQFVIARLPSSGCVGGLLSALSSQPGFVFVVHAFDNQILLSKYARSFGIDVDLSGSLHDLCRLYRICVPILLSVSTIPHNGDDQDDQDDGSGACNAANDAGREWT